MKLSVVMPVYNERSTIQRIAECVASVPLEKEIIIVDDGSTDGTRELLREGFGSRPGFRIIFREQNGGKGSAIRTGIQAAAGEAIIIQDADLEYDPMDYLSLVQKLEEGQNRVVYGSRFLNQKKVTASWHRAVNGLLTSLTNVLYGSKLTDMETCYKLFKAEVIKAMLLQSTGFEIEVELTACALKMGERIIEVPISYKGRTYHEGKKIGWKDGLKAVTSLIYYRFFAA